MTAPIPIGSDPKTPPNSMAIPAPSHTPSSSLSISPQTPFYPPNGLASPPLAGLGALSTTAPGASGGFFKWASSFSKSPSVPESLTGVGGEMTPRRASQPLESSTGALDSHDSHELHDSFEFGDWNDLKSRAWNKNRRALSMSMPRQSGISAMLSPPNGTSNGVVPSASATATVTNNGQGMMHPPPAPPGGVLADKAAKGQGVLKRMSFSNGLRPAFIAPGPLSPPAVTTTTTSSTAESGLSLGSNKAGADIQRAKTISGLSSGQRGRRMSDATKKRGVSPMGERLLRDHGHF